MIIIYNILQIFLLPILVFALFIPKYRKKLIQQLGIKANLPPAPKNGKRIWIHALSVGEVRSALPLVCGLKKQMPEIEICLSASTVSGQETAAELLAGRVDYLIPSPLDILPILIRFHKRIQPDLYIQVETDFWPNRLAILKRRGIAAMLVNGRISNKSFQGYKKASLIFRPIFSSFSLLAMQTASGRSKMIALGLTPEKVITLGNLKYDLTIPDQITSHHSLGCYKKEDTILITAGSTHAGEEEIIFDVFRKICCQHAKIQLIIAPRNIERGKNIEELAESRGFSAMLRSTGEISQPNIIILDSLGELIYAYQICDLALVGGSLVKQGGHNPVEPASCGKPVIFGPYMDDFEEISQDLVSSGGSIQAASAADLYEQMQKLICSPELRRQMGKKNLDFIRKKQGVVEKHLKIIRDFL